MMRCAIFSFGSTQLLTLVSHLIDSHQVINHENPASTACGIARIYYSYC
ncbi:hypothetical protein [Anaerospora sp.]|jgi:hypothetical protein|nr:hypothetical protein [Anaerospora sp.]